MSSKAVVGSEYERLLADFLAAGGDLSACPFDAEGYKYEGPEMNPEPESRLG